MVTHLTASDPVSTDAKHASIRKTAIFGDAILPDDPVSPFCSGDPFVDDGAADTNHRAAGHHLRGPGSSQALRGHQVTSSGAPCLAPVSDPVTEHLPAQHGQGGAGAHWGCHRPIHLQAGGGSGAERGVQTGVHRPVLVTWDPQWTGPCKSCRFLLAKRWQSRAMRCTMKSPNPDGSALTCTRQPQ